MSVFKLALAQCRHPEGDSWRDAAECAKGWCDRASRDGARMLAFPESLMTRYEAERGAFLSAAQPLDGPFCRAMDALARRFGLWLVYTANEANPHSAGLPFNTAVLTGPDGAQRGAYRKTHLFDTDFTRESDRMAAGDALFAPTDTAFGKVGLGICYDLRFPEVARAAALAGCRLFVLPAAWVDGPGKADQWETLLRARAIENGIFVAGVCRADASRIGHSLIVGPQGEVLARGGTGEELVVADIDLSSIDAVRAAMPLLEHRRPELY